MQADLRCWAVLGGYGMSVLTAVTAQNSVEVTAVNLLPPEFVAAQLDAVLSDYGTQAVKTGFVGRTPLIKTIADRLREHDCGHIIIDPVLVNHRGQSMFTPDVTQAYRTHLLPLADLITPNKHEAALLANSSLPERCERGLAGEDCHSLARAWPKTCACEGGGGMGRNQWMFFLTAVPINISALPTSIPATPTAVVTRFPLPFVLFLPRMLGWKRPFTAPTNSPTKPSNTPPTGNSAKATAQFLEIGD